jgi:MraZ protein
MFLGEYTHSIDEKGRIAVPAKFRAGLKNGAVVTRGIDQCLFLYTRQEWKRIAEQIAALPFSQANSRAFARLMLAGAMDVTLDKQGRIVVPDYLRTYAGITKQTIVAGLYNRIEIWDSEKWEQYKAETEKQSEQIAEQLGALGV